MEVLESIKKQVGSRIRELRKAAGFRSVDQFADRVKVSNTTIYELERGENWVSAETLESLAFVLNCPVSALFEEMGEESRKPAKLKLFEVVASMNDEAQLKAILAFAESVKRESAAARAKELKPEKSKKSSGQS